jgi:pimeloyl-ACP methyl ester carboxylesterase
VEIWGDPHGQPVFLLHGTPGSRVGPRPRAILLHHLGVRLITFDRPGYGGSDRTPGRQVANAAVDVEAIADALGLTHFAVIGRSGGGPHALACAALLAERVTRTAALVSLAPRDAVGLDWYAGMTESNVREHSSASDGHRHVAPGLEARSRDIRRDPTRLLNDLRRELPLPDQRVVSDVGVRRLLERTYRTALRTDGGGWIDDVLAFSRPWGFRVEEIPGPVLVWHGAHDVLSPVQHSRWLAQNIPGGRFVLEPEAAHFDALRFLPGVLHWAARDELTHPRSLARWL